MNVGTGWCRYIICRDDICVVSLDLLS